MAADTFFVADRAPNVPSVPGVTLGRPLGAGAGGQVWSGIDATSGAAVAVKVLRCAPDRAGAAAREGAVLARLHHEHLLRLHRVVDLPGTGLALVLELAPGGSLAALVRARGALDAGEVVTVLTPLAGAAAYLHGRGLVHGDVAPANVLFGAHGRPLLADLGTGELTGVGSASRGTPGFTDPGLRNGSRPTPADDVHGIGAVAWYGLTGRVPPPPEQRPPLGTLVPSCPPALARLVERCLDPDPTRRPPADDLARAAFEAAPACPVRLVPTDPSADPGDVVTHRLRRDAAGPAVPAEPAASRGARARVTWGRARLRTAPARRRVGRGRGGSHRRPSGRAPLPAPGRRGALALAVLAVLALTPVGAALTGAGAPARPAGAAGTAGTAGPSVRALAPAPARDPVAAVPALSGHRAEAFATGSRSPLTLADVAGSPAMAADEAVLDRLAAQGAVLRGLSFDVRHVELVDRDADAARVRVTSVTSAHEVVRSAGGAPLVRVPASPPRTVELDLRRLDGRWRVHAVTG